MKFLNEIDGADKLKTDSNNMLVSAQEKSNWNNKSDKVIGGVFEWRHNPITNSLDLVMIK